LQAARGVERPAGGHHEVALAQQAAELDDTGGKVER
jgi:hypothetical protein